MKKLEAIDTPHCAGERSAEVCACCPHPCPGGKAMAENPVPWWVWGLCAAGVFGAGLLVRLLLGR